jgi:hypothetical protein
MLAGESVVHSHTMRVCVIILDSVSRIVTKRECTPHPSEPSIVDMVGMDLVELIEVEVNVGLWEILKMNRRRSGGRVWKMRSESGRLKNR